MPTATCLMPTATPPHLEICLYWGVLTLLELNLVFLPNPSLFNSLATLFVFLVISIFTCLHLVLMVYAVIFLINPLAFILIKHS